MKTRWISLGVAIGLSAALALGFAFGSGIRTPALGSAGGDGAVSGISMAAMDAMHGSPAMLQMHAQMPADLRAQCDAMHEQMDQMMGGDAGSHAAHHADGSASDGMDLGSGGMSGTSGMDAAGMMGS